MSTKIAIELDHAEALVLRDFLERVDNSWITNARKNGAVELRITDMADIMALWTAKAQLDKQLVELFDSAAFARAQRELRDKSGGWPSEH